MAKAIKAEEEESVHGLFQSEGGLRSVVEKLVQASLNAEIERHLQARPYERTSGRRGHRNGYKARRIKTRVGELELRLPQSRDGEYQTQLFGRYQRQEAALLTTIAEMYVQGVSTRRVARIMEKLGGFQVSAATVSKVAQDLDEQLEQLRSRRLDSTEYPYLIIDARYEKIRVNGHVVSQAVLVTAAVNSAGEREILDWRIANSESEATWDDVFLTLVMRGLHGLQLVISDAHSGIQAALRRRFQGVAWQRCRIHFIRELLKRVYWKEFALVAADLKKLFTFEKPEQCRRAAIEISDKWRERFPQFSQLLEAGIDDCLTASALVPQHHHRLFSTNMIERIMRTLKQRTRVIGIFPGRESCHRICGALLWEIHETWRLEVPYLRMSE
jgi:transposase-like protein